MSIHAGLPRISNEGWPRAVAVATADQNPSGDDMMLIGLKNPKAIADAELSGVLRAEAGDNRLVSMDGFFTPESDTFQAIYAQDPHAKIIGCLPNPLAETGK
jgi:hypothetical protein